MEWQTLNCYPAPREFAPGETRGTHSETKTIPATKIAPASNQQMIAREKVRVSVFVSIFLPFAAGYLLSYLFRTINALVAPSLTWELGLSAADVGLLTASYFIAFAAAQIPLGILLDRFGPRKVQGVLLFLAAAGSCVFALGQSTAMLIAGRALIGLGVSGSLMAGLKALAQSTPKARLGLANGCFIMFGGLGALTAAAPSEVLLEAVGWRILFVVLAGLTAAVAMLILALAIPRTSTEQINGDLRTVTAGLSTVYRDRFFWALAPASGCAIGTAWAVQGLWAAQWLADVEQLSRSAVVNHLTIMGAAFCFASIMMGSLLDLLRKYKISPVATTGCLFAVFAGVQLLLLLGIALPTQLLWGVFGAFAACTVLSYTVLGQHFSEAHAARANTALNLIHMTAAFSFQYVVGVVVSLWPDQAGHYPAVAYRTAFCLLVILQIISIGWLIWRTWPPKTNFSLTRQMGRLAFTRKSSNASAGTRLFERAGGFRSAGG